MADIISRRDVLLGIPDAWAQQYHEKRWAIDPDKLHIGARLQSLKGTDYTEKQVNEIIGNASWTSLRCDECEKQVDAVVLFGDPEYPQIKVCEGCLLICADKLAALKGGA